MTVATALVAANDATPQVAEDAVRQALARAGLSHANGVLLFLTTEFARHAKEAVLAASRAAGCLQVAGGVVAGVATETGWVFDRPAAAALVFGGDCSLRPGNADDVSPLFSVAGAGTLPAGWQDGQPRFGGLCADPMFTEHLPIWQQGRLVAEAQASTCFLGTRLHLGVSTGIRLLGAPQTVDRASGYDLEQVAGQRAVDALRRLLPAEFHRQEHPPLAQLSVALPSADSSAPPRLIPLLAANAGGSLTIGERLAPGTRIAWGIRQPVSCEADMRQMIDRLATEAATEGAAPSFGLFVSCIGRGPYFYGADDRDWQAMKDRLPHLPFLGLYGSGQIAPLDGSNRLMQNTVVAALCATGKES